MDYAGSVGYCGLSRQSGLFLGGRSVWVLTGYPDMVRYCGLSWQGGGGVEYCELS